MHPKKFRIWHPDVPIILEFRFRPGETNVVEYMVENHKLVKVDRHRMNAEDALIEWNEAKKAGFIMSPN